jgi:hypothetical protein
MRIGVTTFAVVVCCGLTAGAADDEKYTSKEGKYSIKFPAGAEVKTETTKSDLGNVESGTADIKGTRFTVTYKEWPDTVKKIPAKMLFDSLEKVGTDQGVWKVLSSKDFEFGKDKLPGRSVLVEKKEGTFANFRLVLSGTRMYAFTVNGSKDSVTSEQATKFLDSFELTK